MTTIIIKRDAANNHIRVGDAVVSLSAPGANKEARLWLQQVLFPNEPTPRNLRSSTDQPGQTQSRKRKRRGKGGRKTS